MRCAAPAALPLHRLARPHRSRTAAAAMASSVRIGFLGAGMMAEALAKGFAKAGVAKASLMVATDLSDARLAVFASASVPRLPPAPPLSQATEEGIATVKSSAEVRSGLRRMDPAAQRSPAGCRGGRRPLHLHQALRRARAAGGAGAPAERPTPAGLHRRGSDTGRHGGRLLRPRPLRPRHAQHPLPRGRVQSHPPRRAHAAQARPPPPSASAPPPPPPTRPRCSACSRAWAASTRWAST